MLDQLVSALKAEFEGVTVAKNPPTTPPVPGVVLFPGSPLYVESVMGEEVDWQWEIWSYASVLGNDLGVTQIREMAMKVRKACDKAGFTIDEVSGVLEPEDEQAPYAVLQTSISFIEQISI